MAEFTPTTDEVRRRWTYAMAGDRIHRTDEFFAAFDRWLAEHDLEVAKNAYKRGYADGLETGTADWP